MSVTATIESDRLPVYRSREAPAHLRTKSGLKDDRLKIAEGQRPVAWLRMYRRGHGWGEFALYDPADAARMRPLSAKQQRAVRARHTCPECGTVQKYVVHRTCADCIDTAERARRERYARTCTHCQRVCGAALPNDAYDRRACVPCRISSALRRQAERERHAVWQRTCPGRGCLVVTARADDIEAGLAANRYGWTPRRCRPCEERRTLELAEQRAQRERGERERQAAERQAVEKLRLWAATTLADPDVLVLDTETTGLDDDARIVELAVLNSRGEVLLDVLLDPGVPVPDDASDIHGITSEALIGAAAFSDVMEQLTALLVGKRCLIYNKWFDVGRLRHELTLYYLDRAAREAAEETVRTGTVPEDVRERAVAEAATQAAAWLDVMVFEDVMIPYSDWVGDYSEYHGNNRWQPLNGAHRAAGDCRAVLDCLRAMEKGRGFEFSEGGS